MSDVKAIRYLLAHDAALLNVVIAKKIMAGIIPQGTVMPAIGVTHVTTLRRHAVAETATEYCTSRVQITVQAASYPDQKAILKLVRNALPRQPGIVNTVNVDSLTHELDGPDWKDDDAGIFMQTVDYMITYNE